MTSTHRNTVMPHTPTPIRPELRFKIVEPPELVKIQVARLQDANRDVGICLSIKHEIVPCVAIHVNGEGKDDEQGWEQLPDTDGPVGDRHFAARSILDHGSTSRKTVLPQVFCFYIKARGKLQLSGFPAADTRLLDCPFLLRAFRKAWHHLFQGSLFSRQARNSCAHPHLC